MRLTNLTHYSSYWDWAAPTIETEGLPPVLYEEKIPILLPKSAQKVLIDNPMALFPLQVIPSDFSNIRDGQVKCSLHCSLTNA